VVETEPEPEVETEETVEHLPGEETDTTAPDATPEAPPEDNHQQ
jgi:hypothetical protein